jgi:threonine/homoserine/homoserine lactone efflux protein
MSSILIQAILLASSGLFAVGSITLVVLLLISDRGFHNGFSYAIGYITGYTLIGFVVIVLNYQTSENNSEQQNILFPAFLVVFGILLTWIAFRNWRKPIQSNNQGNRFLSLIDKITPAKAFGFGLIITVINIKNLALFLSALSIVVQSSLPIADKLITMLLVVLVFCSSVIIPVGIYILFPNRRNDLLNGIRRTLIKYRRSISIWAPTIFGSIFIIMGVTELF